MARDSESDASSEAEEEFDFDDDRDGMSVDDVVDDDDDEDDEEEGDGPSEASESDYDDDEGDDEDFAPEPEAPKKPTKPRGGGGGTGGGRNESKPKRAKGPAGRKRKRPAAAAEDVDSVGSEAGCDDDDDDYREEDEGYDDEDRDCDEDENAHPNAGAKKAKKKSTAAVPSNEKKATKGTSKKTIEETYQKKTQLEHVLLRPDTYVGSVEPTTESTFVYDPDAAGGGRILRREITYTPGFYKIFDEVAVNAADNKQRDPDMDRMEVDVDEERGVISVMNNGKGIPVVKHKEHGCYVPTLIFGHLLTGSNFDDDESKTTGGRNGYGAKLANIFSRKFCVECLDSERGLKFRQVWRDNMRRVDEPTVAECAEDERRGGDYVRVTFRPDFDRFGMDGLDRDAAGLVAKRAYDIAGSMANRHGKRLGVYLNGTRIKVKDFRSYLALFDDVPPPEVYEKIGDDWEVGVGSVLDGSGFRQISFVNAIATSKGGGHVDHVANALVKRLQAAVKKKNKGGKDVKPAQVKNHLAVFVNCLVPNPTFDSQTKECLTTKPGTFKKVAPLSEQFLKKVERCGVVESIMQFAKFQEGRALKRKGGTKKNKLKGISKLDDANFAGTAKSRNCTLIVTEGDSAKTLAVSGLSVVGRDYYGVFPLKGKPLNVRDATHAQIMKNEEIMNLVEIMGLKFQQEYDEETVKALRYGRLMIMADQDHDGSHIMGLIINFIHHFWPSLLDVPGFLRQFITPIVKCTKGNKSETFYTLPQFEQWKESTGNDGRGWKIKYYKGLGTSTSSEAKDYFSNLDIHEISFNELSADVAPPPESEDEMDLEDNDDAPKASGSDLIEMAFNKKKADERKKWLLGVQKNTYLDYSDAQRNGVNYSDFINRELVLFSQYDVHRSLPHMLDGLKISQRKVLFACFKKKLKNEIKVAQLTGYIGEHSAYHHGEASLHGTIVGMAQNHCGSNNINLLYPSGQFGTRRMGGKDHASARYIFTRLEKIARAIFHPDDDDLLAYLNDDGLSIEPEYYMPVIPMVLVNGSEGIGTGWSSNIKSHDPREIISNIRRMINKEEPEEMHPYFAGWTGEIIAETGRREGGYIVKGRIKRTNKTTLHITELPIGKWTQDYKKILESMLPGAEKTDTKRKKKKAGDEEEEDRNEGEIMDFKENHTDTSVSFTVTASKENIDAFEGEKDGLLGKFKLLSTISTKNMTAFDKNAKIRHYKTSIDILQDFFRQRMVFYIARKDMLLHKMSKDLSIFSNKARFVEEVCRGDLVVSDRKRTDLLLDLKERGYDLYPKEKEKAGVEEDGDDDDDESNNVDTPEAELSKGYEYLLGMKIWSLTFERAEELRGQRVEKDEEVEVLEATSPEEMWLADLDVIEELLDDRDAALGISSMKQKHEVKAKKKSGSKRPTKAHTLADEWDSSEMEVSETEDSESEESDLDLESEDESSAAKPAPKARAAIKAREKGVINDLSNEESDDSIPAKKLSAKSKPAPNAKCESMEKSKKAKIPTQRRGVLKDMTSKVKAASKSRTIPKGKAVISLGISPTFGFRAKNAKRGNVYDLEDSSENEMDDRMTCKFGK
ncbi:hypothetical protein ACHAWF_014023 [Thalassiosira exigua]